MSHEPAVDPTEGLARPSQLVRPALIGAGVGLGAYVLLALALRALLDERGAFDSSSYLLGVAFALLGAAIGQLPDSHRSSARLRDALAGPRTVARRIRGRTLNGRKLVLDEAELRRARDVAVIALLALPAQASSQIMLIIALLIINGSRLVDSPPETLTTISVVLLVAILVLLSAVTGLQVRNARRFLLETAGLTGIASSH